MDTAVSLVIQSVVEAVAGYRGKFKDRYGYSVPLNISNVFDNDDPLIFRRSGDDSYATRIRLVDGRTYRLSATLKF